MAHLVVAQCAWAATYYVRASGRDDTDGLTPATALRSIAAAAAKINNPGDEVVIGPGTYAEGNLSSPRNGILGRPIAFRGDPTGRRTNDPPGPVRNEPPPPATTGFLLLGRKFVEIADLEIVGGSDAAIQARPSPDGRPSGNLTFVRLNASGSAKRGIDVRGLVGSLRVEECTVSTNGTAGVAVEGDGSSAEVLVGRSKIEANNGPGLSVANVVGAIISDNRFTQNVGAGVLVRAADTVAVTRNAFEANGEESLNAGFPEPLNHLLLENNTTSGSGKSAFKVSVRGEARIEANHVENVAGPAGVGISAAGSESSAVYAVDNEIRSATADCIFLTNGVSAWLQGNSARDCAGHAFRSEFVAQLALKNNAALAPSGSGILVNGTAKLDVVANRIDQPGQTGIAFRGGSSDVMGRVRIVGTKIARAGSVGVFLQNVDAVRIDTSSVTDGSSDGFVLRNVRRVQLQRAVGERLAGLGLSIGSADDFVASSVRIESSRFHQLGRGAVKIWGQGAVTVVGSEILDSGGPGLSIEGQGSVSVSALDNVVGMHEADGVLIRGVQSGFVANNVVFSNRQSGVVLRSTNDMLVANNLIYANREEGLAAGVGGEFSTRTTAVFNTFYQNGLRGLRIDGPAIGTLAGGMVVNNIFARNAGGGMAIARTAMADFISGFNVNPDGYVTDTRRNDFDVNADPMFVNPAGPDGVLGEEGFRDDNFRLAHRRTGQPTNSPAVDAGSGPVEAFGLTGSTATDGLPDIGQVDAGYHYGLEPSALKSSSEMPPPFMPLFVRATGSDANDGRSPARALGSIRNAFDRAVAGVTLVVGPGVYREGDIRIRNFSGRVTFLADFTGHLTGDLPGPVLVDATGFDTGFVVLNGGPVTIRGFHVTGAATAGIQVRLGADQAEIVDNVVFSNQRRGIEVNGANRTLVRNNLVYANGTGGIQVQASQGSMIEGNTVYANGADGILVGTAADGGAAPGTSVLCNIVARNGEVVPAANGVQIKVETDSRDGYFSENNVVWGQTPFAGNTPRADSDIVSDPLFDDPDGADDILGGPGFADDRFTLRQHAGAETSPAVDLDFGSRNAAVWGTTSAWAIPDIGPADAGYHYPLFHPTVRPGPLVFVRARGDDRYDGRSPERAVATLERALALTADGYVVLGPGTYRTSSLLFGDAAPGARTAILWGDETGALTGDPAGPVVLDFGGQRGLTLRGPTVLHGVWITGARNSGLRVLANVTSAWIQHSVFCGNEAEGIWSAGSGVDLIDNLVSGNGGWGVRLTPKRGSGYVRIMNATVVRNGQGGLWAVDRTRPYPQLRLANNIIASNHGPGAFLYAGAARSIPWGFNLNLDGYPKLRPQGPGELSDPPLFASEQLDAPPACPPAGAYRLLPQSPARDRGAGDVRVLGLSSRSAISDGTPDRSAPDLGYHGPLVP